MPTPHNAAKKGAFAKVVLMPGDPLRSKYIVDTFLKDVELVNNVRGIQGYTGYTKNGKRISVMASGMGMPSIGVYSHELFKEYDVDVILRIGTAGSYRQDVEVGDIVLSEGACTNSNWGAQYDLRGGTYSAIASFDVLLTAYEVGKEQGKVVHCGNTLSSDIFYDVDPTMWKRWADMGVMAVEMEAYSLYCNAAKLGKKALAILTISDSFVSDTILTPEERQTGLNSMIELAIATAEKYA